MKIKLYILIFLLFLALVMALSIHPFLACNKPVDAKILVLEGWLYKNKSSLRQAINEFHRGKYKYLVTVGGPFSVHCKANVCPTYAGLAKKKLINLGFNDKLITEAPAPYVKKHRTYTMALAFRIWLMNSKINADSVNVFTYGVHARRSYIVFKQALEPRIRVGVISAEPTDYNSDFWWFSIRGIKWVFYNSLKYFYAAAFGL